MPDKQKSFSGTYKLERETKNTIRYKAVEEFDPIGTLYIQKRDLKDKFGDYPREISVTIEVK